MINVNLKYDDIKAFTEDVVHLEKVYVKTAKGPRVELAEVTPEAACMRFTQKILEIIKSNTSTKKSAFVNAAYTEHGHRILDLKITNTDRAVVLFDTFRKLGIPLSYLRVEYDEGTNTMYLPTKLVRDIVKFNEKGRKQIAMYLLSIVHLYAMFIDYSYKVTYDPRYDELTFEEGFDLTKFVKSFKDIDTTLTIKELSTIDFITAIPYTDVFSKPAAIAPGDGSKFYAGFVNRINKKSGNEQWLMLIEQDLGSAMVDNRRYVMAVDETTQIMFGNSKLSYLDFESDSVYTKCSYAIGSTYKYTCVDDFAPIFANPETYSYEYYGTLEDAFDSKNSLSSVFEAIVKTFNAEELPVSTATSFTACNFASAAGAVCADDVKELYKDDAYAQQLYTQVKPYYDTFNLKELNGILKGFTNGDIYAMMFVGESGTGKSTAARVIPYRCGIPFVSVNFSVNIEESDLFGTMIPNPMKSSAEDPEFIWKDGIITKAVRDGYCVILEELNFARPGVLGKLNSLLDEARQVELSTGEIVTAHKYFRMIATSNIAYEGTNRFNKALVNRFDQCVVFKDLDKLETINVLQERTGYTDTVKLEKIYAVYEALKKFAKEQNLGVVVSIRQLLTLCVQGRYYKNAYEAIINILVNGAFIEDNEYKEHFVKGVMSAFDLKFKI